MAKQISLTFKEDARELELYDWLKSKVSKGAFIKEQLLLAMHNEKNGYVHTIKHNDVTKEIVEEETVVENNEFEFE